MRNQRTLVLCKPDAVQRGLTGQILSRFEAKGLKIVGMKLFQVSEDLAKKHYEEHAAKPFFDELVAFITSSPIVAVALEGESAVEVVRGLMGVTNPQNAGPGTIRGDFGVHLTMNLVHGSDSAVSAERELALFFEPEELVDYSLTIADWM